MNMNYVERAKAIQTDSDIKIRALAPHLNTNEHALSNYLNGKRTMPYDVLVRFAQYFHVTTDYLLGLTDTPEPPFPVSAPERELLTQFRTLTREQKELIAKNVDLMVQQNQRG